MQGNLLAGNIITPGVNADTLLTNQTGIIIRNGGVINNQGMVIIAGDLKNLTTSETNLGAGTFAMSDTVLQTINGQNIFGNLTLNNSAGVNLSGNTTVNGELTFNTGNISIGSYNLLLGTDAIVAGNPSDTSMVIATGNGELRKSFGSAGSFTFPVGDNTGIAEYSPVTLSFEGGSYDSGNYAGVHLVNSVYPGADGSYINRYWDITQNGISGFSCNAAFRFLPADLSGSEEQIYCLRVTPDSVEYFNETMINSGLLLANGLTDFGTFTGLQLMASRTLNLSLFLESLYSGSGNMRQAFNGSGPEFPGLVADQISVELHDATNYSGKVFTVNNINLSTSGNAVVTIPGLYTGSYYVTIRHRNSIETTTAAPVSFAGYNVSYNFDGFEKAYGNNLKMMADGWYLIYGGDVTQDGFVDTGDLTPVDNDAATFVTGYVATDVNGDGSVDTGDITIVDNNGATFVTTVKP